MDSTPGLRPATVSGPVMSARFSPALLLLAISLLAPLGAEAQTGLPQLPSEAPSSLFAAKAKGGSGELNASGSWDFSALSSFSLGSSRGAALGLGQAQPLLFKQTPDLLLGFRYDESWFVDARVSPEGGQSRYAAGYRGREGEVLREFRAGNTGIGLPSLPFVSLGEGGAYSFGALLKAGQGPFDAGALLRYDQADRVRRVYRGSAELNEEVLPVASFLRGRFFSLAGFSGSRPVLYAESLSGSAKGSDGSSWRRLGDEEFLLGATTTEVEIERAVTTRLAVLWSDSSGGLQIDGQPALLVFDPKGAPGPQEDLSRYLIPGPHDELFVRNRASGRREGAWAVDSLDSGLCRVLALPATPASILRPFEPILPDLYTRIPDSEGNLPPSLGLFEIVASSLSASAQIQVDRDAIASSIEVTRNGVADPSFTLDLSQGLLVLQRPPEAAETIEVSYLRQSSERRTGSLTGGLIGRYRLGEDTELWSALWGHLGLPGIGYAEEGMQDPAGLTFALGTTKEQGSLRWKLGAAASLGWAESSGRYRLEGMEEGSLGAGFHALDGILPAGLSFEAVEDRQLEAAWPKLDAVLHADGGSSRSLRVKAADPGDLALEKVLALPPLDSFGSLVFFVTATGSGAGNLELRLDGGPGSQAALRLVLPLAAVAGGAYRIRMDYGPGLVYSQTDEKAPEIFLPGLVAQRDALQTGAGRLLLSLTGLSSGDEVRIDELLLEDPVGSSSLSLSGRLGWEEPEAMIEVAGLEILHGVKLGLDVATGLGSSSFVNSGLSLATGLGPLAVQGALRGLLSKDVVSMNGSHDLGLSLPLLELGDRFSFDPSAGVWSRGFGFELGKKGLAALAFSGKAEGIADQGATALAGLSQDWSASLALLTSALRLEGGLGQRFGVLPSLPSDYLGAWRETGLLLAPFAGEDRRKRTVNAKASLAAETLSLRLSADSGPAALDRSSDEARLRLAPPPLRLWGLGLSPWYERVWSDSRLGGNSDLGTFLLSGGELLGSLRTPREALPFAELFDAATASLFVSDSGRPGLGEAAYKGASGLGLERSPSSTLADLFLPSSLAFALRRELATKGSVVRDRRFIEGSIGWAALELFGSRGSMPLYKDYASDEYRMSLAGVLESQGSAALVGWKLSHEIAASLFGDESRPGDRLIASQRFSFEVLPGGYDWTETAGFELSRRQDSSPLLSLYSFLAGRGAPLSAPALGGGGPTFDSAFLRGLLEARPAARSVLRADCKIKGTLRDGNAPSPALAFSEAWENRLSSVGRLSTYWRLASSQELDGEGALTLGFEAALGLTLSF